MIETVKDALLYWLIMAIVLIAGAILLGVLTPAEPEVVPDIQEFLGLMV